MAGFWNACSDKIKAAFNWIWTYLWVIWFVLVVFLVYVLRTPLKLSENMNLGEFVTLFFGMHDDMSVIGNQKTSKFNDFIDIDSIAYMHSINQNGITIHELI